MGAPQKFKPRQVIAALRETRGMMTLAAERLGCSADTIYNYAKRYPTVAAELKKQRDRTTDIAELKLYQAINDGESWAIQYYLRTQGRGRGYGERHDLDIHHFIVDEAERLAQDHALSDAERDALIKDVEAYANGRP